MSTQFVSNESIVVLNDNFQYEPNKQVDNAKWVDLENVMSVKRDKTIYAVRARNNFDFSQGRNNSSWFANVNGSFELATVGGDFARGNVFTSNIFRGFGTQIKGDVENIFMTRPACVYGNLSNKITANLTQLGIGGSLAETDFIYKNISGTAVAPYAINVQSNVNIMGNIVDANMSASLPKAFHVNAVGNVMNEQTTQIIGITVGAANVDGNTAYQKLFYNNDPRTQWNRLVNANLNGNIMVTASCDPCDELGVANPLVISSKADSNVVRNAQTNEAYRHQFQLRKNDNVLAKQNPIYIARVSRFGQNLTDNQNGNIVSKLSMHSFTGNFAASIPSDNSIYAGANVLTALSVTGNIKMPDVTVFNSNFTTGILFQNGVVGNLNGNATNKLASLSNNSRYMRISQNVNSSVADYVRGGPSFANDAGDILPTGTFASGDRVGLVQANVNLVQGYMLLDRIAFKTADPTFVQSSRVFSGFNTNNDSQNTFTSDQFDTKTVEQNYSKLWFQSNLLNSVAAREVSSKYLVLKGVNVIGNNWQTVSLMAPTSVVMPSITGNPNLQYLQPGNLVNLYVRRGQLSMDNYTYVNNKTITGVKYIDSVPGFVESVVLPNGNITLSSNVVGDMNPRANIQLSLPLLPGATSTLSGNVIQNFKFVFSGNANVDQRVTLRSNVVCPVNFANSFIANCWSYGTAGQDIYASSQFTANVRSNVAIHYGNFPININVDGRDRQIQTLSLNDEMSKYNVQYELEFPRSTGRTLADSTLTQNNYVFYANVTADGSKPNVIITNNNQVSTAVLNQNRNINGMHRPDVAYSEYSFSSQSYKFTDYGNVLGNLQRSVNWNVSTILPTAKTNQNSGTPPNDANQLFSDNYINIITDYLNFNAISNNPDDIHQVTCSNFAYRYNVDSISVPGNAVFDNDVMVNGASYSADTLFSNKLNLTLSGGVRAATVSCYVYENVDNSSQPELLYPFTIPGNDNILIQSTTASNLFPCFTWKAVSGGYAYFQNKSSDEVNFVLPNNTTQGSQSVQLTIYSVDSTTSTMKVGMTTQNSSVVPKTIKIVPIVHGRDLSDNVEYATPIVCGVQGEPNTYVVVMVRCDSSGIISSSLTTSLPASINLNVIDKTSNGVNQVTCRANLRVFSSTGVLQTSIQDNYTFKGPRSQFTFAPGNGSNLTASLSLNVFSYPPNNAIISMVYKQNVINRVLSFNRTDYVLNSSFSGYNAVSVNASSVNFAFSNTNNSLTAQSDRYNTSNPLINPLSTRFYLENAASGIWIDIRNDANNNGSNLPILTVDRSVEWTLKRTWNNITEEVGRGLLSKSSTNAANSLTNYLIYENLLGSKKGSGYAHNVYANLNDLCSRLLLQSLQTSPVITNGVSNRNNWLINSKSDQINIMLVAMNPSTNIPMSNTPVKTRSVYLDETSGQVDLGRLFVDNDNQRNRYSGSLGIISLSAIRGYGVNFNAQQGTVNLQQSIFSYNVQPDCYSLVQQRLTPSTGGTKGEVLTRRNVLFSEETKVDTTNVLNGVTAPDVISTADITLSLSNASLAYQFLDTSSPTLSTTSFVQIGYYLHNGYGQIQYYVKDFTSNYGTDLTSEQSTTNATTGPVFGNSQLQSFQVDNVSPTDQPTRTVNILYDANAGNANGKYYFNLDEEARPLNPVDRVFFRGTGLSSLPTQLNNNTTLLLYTGLRPLILNILQVAANGTTLEQVMSSASIFNFSDQAVNNASAPNVFTTNTTSGVRTAMDTTNLSTQFYQIVLTNNAAADNNQSFQFRASLYSPTTAWLAPYNVNDQPNRNFFGTYTNSSNLLKDLRLRVTRQSGVNTVYALASTMRSPLENPQKTDNQIIQGAISNSSFTNNAGALLLNSGSAAFTISGDNNKNNRVLGDMFTISIQGVIPDFTAGDGEGFKIDINPSTLTLYSALDVNNNGEIDTNVASNVDGLVNGITSTFGLNSMFSELNFKLNLPPSSSQYLKPAEVSKTTLNREFINVPGAPFDIRLNNLFSVGYNLDCFFAIRNTIAAEFDVISIDTKASTNLNGEEVTNLVVNAATAPLVIANPNEWARSLVTGNGVDTNQYGNYGSPSGLTFKLKNSTKNVVANQVVRLYVDNTIANNTLEWNVSVAGNTAKTYQLYTYDQDRYAALLDEQLSIRNSFVNQN